MIYHNTYFILQLAFTTPFPLYLQLIIDPQVVYIVAYVYMTIVEYIILYHGSIIIQVNGGNAAAFFLRNT